MAPVRRLRELPVLRAQQTLAYATAATAAAAAAAAAANDRASLGKADEGAVDRLLVDINRSLSPEARRVLRQRLKNP